MTLSGIFLAYFIYSFGLDSYFNIKQTKSYKLLFNFINRKWYFDRIYNQNIGQKFLDLSYIFSYKDIDRGILEIFGPFGLVKTVTVFKNYLKDYQSGNVFHILFIISISLIVILLLITMASYFYSNF